MISANFSRSEFECQCRCGFDTVDAELIAVLEDLRTHFRHPVVVNSGCRCKSHNADVGGGATSQHLTGRAADVHVLLIDPEEVQEYLDFKHPHDYGIGSYNTFTHIDTRNKKARW